jgi:ribonuclease HII
MNPLHEFDLSLLSDYDYVCGTDEVGRGCILGSICSASVILKPTAAELNIKDSKKLSEKAREALYDQIINNSVAYSIQLLDADAVDTKGIQYCNRQVMQNSQKEVQDLLTYNNILFIADGNPLWTAPNVTWIQQGDNKSLSIAAASILAKVYRDRLLIALDKIYPAYKFAQHKGYGTKIHYEAIKENGIIEGWHRKTFLKDILYGQ